MKHNCGNCSSSDVELRTSDPWYYYYVCNNCGAQTMYQKNGEIFHVDKNYSKRLDEGISNLFDTLSNQKMSDKEMKELKRKGTWLDIDRTLGKWNYKHGWEE